MTEVAHEGIDSGAGVVLDDAAGSRFHSAHVLALDGFRGLAVILVVLHHFDVFSLAEIPMPFAFLGKVFRSGWIGVDMFFALSGFLITNILLKTLADPHYFKNFYIRRTLRIFPLYYGVVLLLAALTPLLHIQWNHTLAPLLLYVQNFILPLDRLRPVSSVGLIRLSHLWSLAVEEQFYLVWPFLVWIFRDSRILALVPLTLMIGCPVVRWIALQNGFDHAALYEWTPFRVDSLAWGAFGSMLLHHVSRTTLVRFRWISMLAGAAGVSTMLLTQHGALRWENSPEIRFVGIAMGALSCGILLFLVQPGVLLERLFRMSMLRWLGRYSYGIYVFHYMLIGPFNHVRQPITSMTGSRLMGDFGFLVVGLLATCSIAWISFHFYERPFTKLKDVLARYTT